MSLQPRRTCEVPVRNKRTCSKIEPLVYLGCPVLCREKRVRVCVCARACACECVTERETERACDGAILCPEYVETHFSCDLRKITTEVGFPGSSVIKNPPAEAGDNRFSPWSWRIPSCHGANKTRAPQLLSLCSGTPCSPTREATTKTSWPTATRQ